MMNLHVTWNDGTDEVFANVHCVTVSGLLLELEMPDGRKTTVSLLAVRKWRTGPSDGEGE